jgi:hypothetical protein
MHDKPTLSELLAADPLDPGCDAGIPIIDQYVEMELAGKDPAVRFPGMAVHLRSCNACRADHDGLLALADDSRQDGPHGA